MPNPPTPDQLRKIVERLTGAKGLLVPAGPTSSKPSDYVDGPQFVIAATIYEGQPERAAQVLWAEIPKHDVAQLVTDFAGINLLQSKEQFGGAVHEWLERVCLTDEHRKLAMQSDSGGPQHRVQLFQQVGILIALKAILSCAPVQVGGNSRTTWLTIGNIAMAANVFVTGKEWRFIQNPTGRKLLHLDRQLATDDAVLDDLRSYLK